jgi:hypothetical protein
MASFKRAASSHVTHLDDDESISVLQVRLPFALHLASTRGKLCVDSKPIALIGKRSK